MKPQFNSPQEFEEHIKNQFRPLRGLERYAQAGKRR